MTATQQLIEQYVPEVAIARQLKTNLPVDFSGAPSVALPSSVTVSAGQNITSAAANAFSVGPNGVTNPSFNVDASATTAVTGLNVAAAAAGSGVTVSVIGGNANEPLTIQSKGTGTIILQSLTNGTNAVSLRKSDNSVVVRVDTTNARIRIGDGTAPAATLDVLGTTLITNASASALVIGANGATNPILVVDTSVSSVATGLSVQGQASGSGVIVTAITSGTNENIIFRPAGTGTFVVKSTTNTTNAFSVQNSSGTAMMRADTSNARLRVGDGAAPNSTLDLAGDLTISAHNIITDAVTGMKIGTATSQLIGFFNTTPVAQRTQGATFDCSCSYSLLIMLRILIKTAYFI